LNKIQISSALLKQIQASAGNETLYIPKNGSSVSTSPEFFAAVADKTIEVELLTVGEVVKGGRSDKNGIATSDDVYRAVCKLRAGSIESEVRLHLCDIVGLAQSGGKGVVSFGVYQPTGKTDRYLVPKSANRATTIQIIEFLSKVENLEVVGG
jgi:hypothetical protein